MFEVQCSYDYYCNVFGRLNGHFLQESFSFLASSENGLEYPINQPNQNTI